MDKYLGYFDAVCYINLDRRDDRKILFEEQAMRLSIPATRFSAIEAQDSEVKYLYEGHVDITRKQKIGCNLSHQHIIKWAKKNQKENVLIFEDDCYFLDAYKEKIQEVANDLKDVDWDILYLGGEPNNYCIAETNNLAKIKNGGVYCLHAYAVNHKFYDKMLLPKANEISLMDLHLLNMNDTYRKCYLTRDLLTTQKDTYSDLWDTITNSSKIIKNSWDKFVPKSI